MVREACRGLIKRFIRRNGIEALRPKRAEPITPSIVERVAKIPLNAKVGALLWNLAEWSCFIVYA